MPLPAELGGPTGGHRRLISLSQLTSVTAPNPSMGHKRKNKNKFGETIRNPPKKKGEKSKFYKDPVVYERTHTKFLVLEPYNSYVTDPFYPTDFGPAVEWLRLRNKQKGRLPVIANPKNLLISLFPMTISRQTCYLPGYGRPVIKMSCDNPTLRPVTRVTCRKYDSNDVQLCGFQILLYTDQPKEKTENSLTQEDRTFLEAAFEFVRKHGGPRGVPIRQGEDKRQPEEKEETSAGEAVETATEKKEISAGGDAETATERKEETSAGEDEETTAEKKEKTASTRFRDPRDLIRLEDYQESRDECNVVDFMIVANFLPLVRAAMQSYVLYPCIAHRIRRMHKSAARQACLINALRCLQNLDPLGAGFASEDYSYEIILASLDITHPQWKDDTYERSQKNYLVKYNHKGERIHLGPFHLTPAEVDGMDLWVEDEYKDSIWLDSEVD